MQTDILVPVILTGRGIGGLKTMIGIAEAINPEQHFVATSPFALARILMVYRHEARRLVRHEPCAQQAIIPVIINGGRGRWRYHSAKLLKKFMPDCLTIQIGHPRVNDMTFDLVAVMPCEQPDTLKAPEVLTIHALPTPINDHTLAEARSIWSPKLVSPSRKLLAIIVGGDVSRKNGQLMEARDVHTFIDRIKSTVDPDVYDIALTTSRRTSPAVTEILRRDLVPLCRHSYFFRENDPANPYTGYLACADALLATADSMSVLSELADSHKPSYAFWPPHMKAPAQKTVFLSLVESGHIQSFEGPLDHISQPPIRSAEAIAARALGILAARAA